MAISEYKACKICGEAKAATAEFFYRQHGDGLQSCCKLCVIQRTAAWAAAHPDAVLASRQSRAGKNNARAKAWRLANPERAREAQRRKRQANPERYRQYVRDWSTRNPGLKNLRASEYQIRRRAQMFGDGNTVDLVDYAAILTRDGMVCHICAKPIEAGATGSGKLNFDHVIPLAKGGVHSAENIRPSHFECNRQKWDSLP